MSAPKGADITDAATRSALVLLFKQFVLATPKTRSLTITIGDIKITSPPVQHTHWQAARGQPGPRRFSSGQQQGHRVHNAKQRRSANRAAERAGQPPPYPKPSMLKEGHATYPGSAREHVVVRTFANSTFVVLQIRGAAARRVRSSARCESRSSRASWR